MYCSRSSAVANVRCLDSASVTVRKIRTATNQHKRKHRGNPMGASLVVLDSSSDDVYNQHIIASSLALSRPLGSTSTNKSIACNAGSFWRFSGSRVTTTPTPNQRDTKKTRLRFRMLGIAFFWHNYGVITLFRISE